MNVLKSFYLGYETRALPMQIIKIVSLTFGLALISQFVLFINIVPLSLQTLYITVVGLLCTRKTSVQYLSLYLAMAIIGLPVLAGAQGFNPVSIVNFGLVVGFIAMGYIISYFTEKGFYNSYLKIIAIIIFANVVLYSFGIIWLAILHTNFAFVMLLPYMLFDVLKMTIGVILYKWLRASNLFN